MYAREINRIFKEKSIHMVVGKTPSPASANACPREPTLQYQALSHAHWILGHLVFSLKRPALDPQHTVVSRYPQRGFQSER